MLKVWEQMLNRSSTTSHKPKAAICLCKLSRSKTRLLRRSTVSDMWLRLSDTETLLGSSSKNWRPHNHCTQRYGRPVSSTFLLQSSTLQHSIIFTEDHTTIIRVLFVDFSKAFDVIDHNVLLNKFISNNIPEHVIVWSLDFLNDRKQFVVTIGNSISNTTAVGAGTPKVLMTSNLL